MILNAEETRWAGNNLATIIGPLFNLRFPVIIDPVIPSTKGWPSTRRGSYRTATSWHHIRLTADLPLNVSTVSIVAHELCHAWQYETHSRNMPFIVCYSRSVSEAGYRASAYERTARAAAHSITSYLVEKLETEEELAELCGLEWRE